MLHQTTDLQRSSRALGNAVSPAPDGASRAPLDPNKRLRIHGPIQPLDEPSLVSRFMDFLRAG